MLHFRNPMQSEQRKRSVEKRARPNRAAGTTHSLPDALAAQWNRDSLRADIESRIKSVRILIPRPAGTGTGSLFIEFLPRSRATYTFFE